MSAPAIYDHVRPQEDGPGPDGESGESSDEPVPDGIYRVVGTGGPVVLLRLTDADGRREHTGEVVRVPRSTLEARFVDAENPDSGLSVGDIVPPVGDYLAALRYWLPF